MAVQQANNPIENETVFERLENSGFTWAEKYLVWKIENMAKRVDDIHRKMDLVYDALMRIEREVQKTKEIAAKSMGGL